ncbi:hypothetical protein [Mesorhizobium sp. ESP-6-2]|uniref:hypothetical protein n=1 Tax=Mesorhizobium sp. ESP-6-2 TaxID=2876625 RepID=UPI001CCCA6F2|nr:hypothetical protein [Mesorhizobium sp. ESP-6-2]MBZ9811076.1 hypothetical protein [Mesorhizobium sp. ESP-6-2]
MEILEPSLDVLALAHHALPFEGHSTFHGNRRRDVGRRQSYQARVEALGEIDSELDDRFNHPVDVEVENDRSVFHIGFPSVG